ncbi:MAG: Asp-tRNA(Asn)/Glu-tRNA(Gln) amidotransferase subunit GatC [Candidatus Omnitrophota bacterium]
MKEKHKENVEYVAKLARIKITSQEKEVLSEQLSKIIGYIDKLKELDVEGIEPLRGLHISKNIFREDKAFTSTSRDDILKNSPSQDGDHFKIPKVIE